MLGYRSQRSPEALLIEWVCVPSSSRLISPAIRLSFIPALQRQAPRAETQDRKPKSRQCTRLGNLCWLGSGHSDVTSGQHAHLYQVSLCVALAVNHVSLSLHRQLQRWGTATHHVTVNHTQKSSNLITGNEWVLPRHPKSYENFEFLKMLQLEVGWKLCSRRSYHGLTI